MKVEKRIVKRVLEKLYKDSFPDPCLVANFRERLFKESAKELKLRDWSPIETAGCYLVDKGLIKETSDRDGKPEWRITALGIDLLEKRNLLEPEPAKPVKFDGFVIDKEN